MEVSSVPCYLSLVLVNRGKGYKRQVIRGKGKATPFFFVFSL
ncbi:hypothetical protein ISN45_Aa06g007020 [Arabidopsis thaliana x Arabidopsis arenosa]|uniref:Uncharacterized protein n=1 Tax=Arabidopsis thaliana x Arabidopsis arenosa TaxID=1240361 RepID=A0A8T1YTX4_9BRAS|nr:hypothetical protein ISN45_Aa06g007020 [Arabidopsis thaliana x Arabidopsis arenosa]